MSKMINRPAGNSDEVSDSLDSTSEDRPYCQHCKQDFVSDADLRRHALGCSGQSNPADSSASHHGNVSTLLTLLTNDFC